MLLRSLCSPSVSSLMLAALLTLSTASQAQLLSSPLGTPPPSESGSANPLSGGSGTGVHSPLSPFAPLPKRNDVVPWSTLSEVRSVVKDKQVMTEFAPAIQTLDRKKVRLQGFMMPLDPGEGQRQFLLASVPLTCSFCTPGGAESIVHVSTRTPVKYTLEAVVMEGVLQVLKNDPQGFYYRMTEAIAVK